MTRLLFLPDDTTVIQLEVDIPTTQLCTAVNSGMRPLPVLRNSPAEKLVASMIGETVIVAPASAQHNNRKTNTQHSGLSRRQAQVHDLSVRGLTSGEIAVMLHLSRRTVNYHLNQVKNRLRLSDQPKAEPAPMRFNFSDEY